MATKQYHFLDDLREVYRAFKKEDGEYKLISGAKVGHMNLSELGERKIRFLSDILDFVLKGNFLSETTMMWFDSIESDRNDALEDYNNLHDIQISKSVARGQWDNNKNTLLKFFPDRIIRDVCSNRVSMEDERISIEEAERHLKDAVRRKHGITKLREMSVLKLPSTMNDKQPSNEKLDEFFMLIAPYLRERVHVVESQIPKDSVSYINYLYSQSKWKLTEQQREIIDRLERLGQSVSEFSDDDYEIE